MESKPNASSESNSKESSKDNDASPKSAKEASKATISEEYEKLKTPKEESSSVEDNMLQFLVIKEEPLEWNEVNEEDMQLIESGDMFNSDIAIKPEVLIEEQQIDSSDLMYTPLTCELCSETFRLPADWVRHVHTHTDMLPAKRQRRGFPNAVSFNTLYL